MEMPWTKSALCFINLPIPCTVCCMGYGCHILKSASFGVLDFLNHKMTWNFISWVLLRGNLWNSWLWSLNPSSFNYHLCQPTHLLSSVGSGSLWSCNFCEVNYFYLNNVILMGIKGLWWRILLKGFEILSTMPFTLISWFLYPDSHLMLFLYRVSTSKRKKRIILKDSKPSVSAEFFL